MPVQACNDAVLRKGDQVKIDGIEHQLDAKQDDDSISFRQYPEQTDDKTKLPLTRDRTTDTGIYSSTSRFANTTAPIKGDQQQHRKPVRRG